MSRLNITPLDPDHEVAIGWDNPLQTFFAQVTQPDGEDDKVLLWLGTSWGEHTSPEMLIKPLAPYARLSPDIVDMLHDQRAEASLQPPTDLQRTFKDLFSRDDRDKQ